MWIAIGVFVLVALGVFGWAACALGGRTDDDLMRRYERERDTFRGMFE